MLQIKVGVKLANLKMPFKNALQIAARLGADAVEIDARHELKPSEMSGTALRHFRKLLEDLNLRVSAVSFQTRGSYYDLKGLDQRVEATKEALKLAYQLGANVVVNQIGRVPTDPEHSNYQTLLETLADIGRAGQRVGAFLAARTGSEDGKTLCGLLRDLPEGALAVDFDPGSLIINGFSAADAIQQLGQYVLHVHARDGVQDLAQGRGLEVPLGRGSADFPNLLGSLEEHQYRGYLTVQRDQANDPVLEIGQAIQFLKNLV